MTLVLIGMSALFWGLDPQKERLFGFRVEDNIGMVGFSSILPGSPPPTKRRRNGPPPVRVTMVGPKALFTMK